MSHKNKPEYMTNFQGDLIDAAKPTYAPDGVLAGCWRKVRKGGRIKMGGSWWQHNKLKEHINRWVWCEPTEYWHVATAISHNRPGMRAGLDYFENHICTATGDKLS